MNEHDMAKAEHLLVSSGFEPACEIDEASIVLVNTCCVREKAEQKFYSLMGRLQRAKKKRGFILGVTGCVAQAEKEGLLDRLPFVDFSLGPSAIHRVSEAVLAALDKRTFLDFSDNGCHSSLYVRPGVSDGLVRAFVTVMKGCDNFCSYCIVPHVRGREVSRSSGDVREEVEELAASGVREVILLGQNVNSYNRGASDLSFPGLLRSLNGVRGLERIRFVTSHPKDLSQELINCFGTLSKLCEQIHLPFQSGSDRILGLMNRGYTKEEYLRKVGMLKERCPDIAITTDCIVGFPGETDEDFRETMDLVERVAFDGVFSFCYSPRKNTRASELADRVERQTARARLQELQATQKAITLRTFRGMEGSRTEVLVEGASKNSKDDVTGRTRTNRIVNFKGTPDLRGKLVEVEIVKGCANSLRGLSKKE